MRTLATALGGHYRPSPMFSLRGRLITVHPLGGCAMGRHPGEGWWTTGARCSGTRACSWPTGR